jgi:nitrogen-specific signal transduction histidine kinase
MGSQGRIQIEVTTVDTSCVIAFTDQGPGIPADVLDKIFMPCFTTKARGSGLGIPVRRDFLHTPTDGLDRMFCDHERWQVPAPVHRPNACQ